MAEARPMLAPFPVPVVSFKVSARIVASGATKGHNAGPKAAAPTQHPPRLLPPLRVVATRGPTTSQTLTKAKAKAMVKQLNGELQRQAPEGSLLQEGTIALYVRSL